MRTQLPDLIGASGDWMNVPTFCTLPTAAAITGRPVSLFRSTPLCGSPFRIELTEPNFDTTSYSRSTGIQTQDTDEACAIAVLKKPSKRGHRSQLVWF